MSSAVKEFSVVASHLPLTMAEIRVPSSLESAKEKLKQNNFPFEDLPNDPNSSLWTRIEEKYSLSLYEISALQNKVAGTTSISVMFHCSLISIPTTLMCAVSNPYPNWIFENLCHYIMFGRDN